MKRNELANVIYRFHLKRFCAVIRNLQNENIPRKKTCDEKLSKPNKLFPEKRIETGKLYA